MRIKTGCDIVHLSKFEHSASISFDVAQGKAGFLAKIFTEHELSHNLPPETLAGFFAAKEAVMKALDLPAGSWQQIEIVKSETGHPEVRLAEPHPEIASNDLSISHDGEYVIATAVFLFET